MGETIIDPATLAENAALQVQHEIAPSGRNIRDSERLRYLDQAAEDLGIRDTSYWVEASRAIALPAETDFDPREQIDAIDYQRVAFEGVFMCYARVRVARILGPKWAKRISALCLTFHEPLIVPQMRRLPYEKVLYVPVLAIDSIEQSSRIDDDF